MAEGDLPGGQLYGRKARRCDAADEHGAACHRGDRERHPRGRVVGICIIEIRLAKHIGSAAGHRTLQASRQGRRDVHRARADAEDEGLRNRRGAVLISILHRDAEAADRLRTVMPVADPACSQLLGRDLGHGRAVATHIAVVEVADREGHAGGAIVGIEIEDVARRELVGAGVGDGRREIAGQRRRDIGLPCGQRDRCRRGRNVLATIGRAIAVIEREGNLPRSRRGACGGRETEMLHQRLYGLRRGTRVQVDQQRCPVRAARHRTDGDAADEHVRA